MRLRVSSLYALTRLALASMCSVWGRGARRVSVGAGVLRGGGAKCAPIPERVATRPSRDDGAHLLQAIFGSVIAGGR